jgi:hypothetical protein
MIHKIVSFYQTDLPQEIVSLQKRVFNHFDLDVEQIGWDGQKARHTGAIQGYLDTHFDYDFISLFDVDCFPTSKNWLKKTIDIISDQNTVYGNAQASNVFPDINPYRTPPFVNGGVFNMSYKVWSNSSFKSVHAQMYPNPDGNLAEADGYEALTRELEKRGRRIVLSYPTYCPTDHTWKYGGGFGYPPFSYGNGTEYDSDTFHNFQIRIPDKRIHFLKRSKSILGEIFNIEEYEHILT